MARGRRLAPCFAAGYSDLSVRSESNAAPFRGHATPGGPSSPGAGGKAGRLSPPPRLAPRHAPHSTPPHAPPTEQAVPSQSLVTARALRALRCPAKNAERQHRF